MLQFLIISPTPKYIDFIGGVTVAHTLASELKKAGANVKIYADSTSPKYDIECIPHYSKFEFNENNTVVVFIAGAGDHTFLPKIPEYLQNAKYVIRWQVNHQTRHYPENNRFYKFHKYWTTFTDQKIDGYLSVIDMNEDIFYDHKIPNRQGNCFWVKGHLDTEQERFINNEQEDICIDTIIYNIPHTLSTKFLSYTFNTCKTFVSYNPLSFSSTLAAICGCVSIIIPKSDFDKEKWMSEIWCTKYGIAVGLDDIPRAIETMPLIPNMVDEYVNITQKTQVRDFIQDCNIWVNS